MRPVTCTWLELPVRTSTLPEPVVKSRCTGPVTCKARWNEPSPRLLAGKAEKQIKPAIGHAGDEPRQRAWREQRFDVSWFLPKGYSICVTFAFLAAVLSELRGQNP